MKKMITKTPVMSATKSPSVHETEITLNVRWSDKRSIFHGDEVLSELQDKLEARGFKVIGSQVKELS